MNPCEVTAVVTAAANLFFECFSKDELQILAAAFTQLGDTLSTQLAVCETAESAGK